MNDWLVDWDARYESAWIGQEDDLTDLEAELDSMLARHPGWDGTLQDPPPPALVPRSPSSTGSSAPSRGMGTGVEQWRTAVAVYDWNVEVALCLMAKESGGNPNAQNPSSGASGLMQVLPSWAPKFGYEPADLFNPTVNLAISYALYADGGWNHWSPWLRGSCR